MDLNPELPNPKPYPVKLLLPELDKGDLYSEIRRRPKSKQDVHFNLKKVTHIESRGLQSIFIQITQIICVELMVEGCQIFLKQNQRQVSEQDLDIFLIFIVKGFLQPAMFNPYLRRIFIFFCKTIVKSGEDFDADGNYKYRFKFVLKHVGE